MSLKFLQVLFQPLRPTGTPPIPIVAIQRERIKCVALNGLFIFSVLCEYSPLLPCVAQQYRGETEERQRRREGLKKKHIGFFCRTNPLARWALPLYRYAAQGERAKMRFEYFKLLHCRVPVALWSISVSLSETFKTPPLCFVTQNIGEVARSDGGVENDISSVCLYPFSPAVSRSITGYCVRNIGETPKKQ